MTLSSPPEKKKYIAKTQEKVDEYEQQYLDGLITQGENYNKVVDAWGKCTDLVVDAMMKGLAKSEIGKPLNAVYMMTHSGARGSADQMKQLAGMRGLIAKPNQEIIKRPIISNFKEGLSVIEYFNSTHGARKGLTDTALKTANSGYLTRRLVDVAQDVVIVEKDCGVKDGMRLSAIVDGGEVLTPLTERTLGRVTLNNVVDEKTEKCLIKANTLIKEKDLDIIEKHSIDQVVVRSPLTCQSEGGICQTCYGRDLARGHLIHMGEAVGVIAAQSIGEPGTQLTMRTFHIGGAAQKGTEKFDAISTFDGLLEIKNRNVVASSDGAKIVMGRYCELFVKDAQGGIKTQYHVPYGAKLFADDGSAIKRGQKLAEWDPYTIPIITERSGIVQYVDLVDGSSVRAIFDETTGMSSSVVVDWKQQSGSASLKPQMTILDTNGKPIQLPHMDQMTAC